MGLPSIEIAPKHELFQFFNFEHLPAHLQAVSAPFYGAARAIIWGNNPQWPVVLGVVRALDDNIMRREALKLIESVCELMQTPSGNERERELLLLIAAKDNAVRAKLYKTPESA